MKLKAFCVTQNETPKMTKMAVCTNKLLQFFRNTPVTSRIKWQLHAFIGIKCHGKVDSKCIWYAHGITINYALVSYQSLKSTQQMNMSCPSSSSYPIPPVAVATAAAPYFYPLYRHFPLTIHITWIGFKICPIPIFRSRFKACLPQYV